MAVEPPASLAVEKQRRLCLGAAHRSCATYLAARHVLVASTEPGDVGTRAPQDDLALTPRTGAAGPGRSSVRWSLPRTAPVVLDRGRPSLRAILVHRSVAQLGLVLLMALAFLVLALARLSAGDAGTGRPAASSSPAVAASAAPTASSRPSPSTAPSTSRPPASPAGTQAGSPSPPASSGARTYRVVAGDTLSGIAARFGVTVRALQSANGIKDPSRIRIGTVLVIP